MQINTNVYHQLAIGLIIFLQFVYNGCTQLLINVQNQVRRKQTKHSQDLTLSPHLPLCVFDIKYLQLSNVKLNRIYL